MATNNYDDIQFAIKVVNEASKSLNKIESDLKSLASQTGVAAKKMKGEFNKIDSSAQKLKATFTKIRSAGIGLTAGLTAPLVLLGKQAIQTAAQFEQSLANAFSVMGDASKEARVELTGFAEQLGRDTAFKASEAADAMYKLASAGLETAEIINTLPGILDAAAATQSDLAAVAEQTTVAMKTFNIASEDAQRITDGLVGAIANSNLNFERITESMKFAGPAMATFGKSVEETYAALGFFADAGIFGAKAGTLLRSILARLSSPTSSLKEVISELGLTMEDLNPKTKSVGEILETLRDAGLSTEQSFKGFGRIIAGPVSLALQRANEEGRSVTEMMAELEFEISKTGTAAKVAQGQLDTLAGSWKVLGSSIENVFIQFTKDVFGDSLKDLVNIIIKLVNAFASLPAVVKKGVVVFAGVLAIMGPLLLIVGAFGTAMLALAGPIAVIVAGLTALILVAGKLKGDLDELFGIVDPNADKIRADLEEGFKNPILDTIRSTTEDTLVYLEILKNNLRTALAAGVDPTQAIADLKRLSSALESTSLSSINEANRQKTAQIATIKVMEKSGKLSEELAKKYTKAITDETTAYVAEQAKIKAQADKTLADIAKVGGAITEAQATELQTLLKQQQDNAQQTLAESVQEVINFGKTLNSAQAIVAQEQVTNAINIQQEIQDKTVSAIETRYADELRALKVAAKSQNDEVSKDAKAKLSILETQYKNELTVAQQGGKHLVGVAKQFARARGDVYDEANNKFLTGWSAVWAKVKSVVNVVVNNIMAVFVTLRGALAILIGAAIIGFANGFKDIAGNIGALMSVFKSLGILVGTVFLTIGAVIIDTGKTVFNVFKRMGQNIQDSLAYFKAFGAFVVNVFTGAFGAAVDTVKEWGKSIFNVFTQVKDAAVNIGKAVKEGLKGNFGAAKDIIVGTFQEASDDIDGQSFADRLKENYADALSEFSASAKKISSREKVDILDYENTKELVNKLKEDISGVGDAFGEFSFENTKKGFKQLGKYTDNITDGIGNAWEKALDPKFEPAGIEKGFDQALLDAKSTAKEIEKEFEEVDPDIEDPFKDASKGADTLGKKVESLGKELEEAGVFAVKSGGKIVDSFDDAEDGVSKVKDAIAKLDEQFIKQQEEVRALTEEIKNRMENLSVPDAVLTSMDEADNKLKDIKTDITEILKEHDTWMDAVETDLENFKQLLTDINAKFDEQKQKIAEQATQDITSQYSEALSKIKELQAEREKALAAGDNVSDLNNQISALEKMTRQFEALKNSATDYTAEIEKAREKLALLNEQDASQSAIQKKEQELAILLGKQKIFVDEKDKLEEELGNAKAERNLSELDFIAYKLGKELQAIETKRQAEIQSAKEINDINKAIVSGDILNEGFVEGLKTSGYSDESIAFAEQAKVREELYRAELAKQLEDLTRFKEDSVAIYTTMTDDFIAQQQILENYVSLSVDKMVVKYQELAAAARKAAEAQKKALSARSSGSTAGLKEGGFADLLGFMRGGFVSKLKGFDAGGYTGAGKADAVAGVVHKGEWVAPKWMVSALRPMFGALDSARKSKNLGAITGATKNLNNSINMNNYISEQVDFQSVARNLSFELSRL